MPQYHKAARRHFDDACLLMEHKRIANADHLFGLAAECALKSFLRGMGMKINSFRPKEKQFRSHIDMVWEHFQTFSYRRSAIRYFDQVHCLPQSPFSDWCIEQRYKSGENVQPATVEAHKAACVQVNACLSAALLDGVLDDDSL